MNDAPARCAGPGTACRLVHGEGDALPSLVLDRYDRYLVGQLLSAGLETQRPVILSTLRELLRPAGVLLRHDVPVRRREGLSDGVEGGQLQRP